MKYVGAKAVAFAKKPGPSIWAALAFCEDEGVANDAARKIVSAWVGDDPDAEINSVSEDDVRKDPGALFDALEARSLLGAKRVIRIRTSGDKIATLLKEVVEAGEDSRDRFEAKLIVTAGSLQKKSKLRTAFEGAKNAAALQLFPDELGDVSDLIRQTIGEAGLEIDDMAVSALALHLPGHRRMIHAELEKLALFARDFGRPISQTDIQSVCISSVDSNGDAYVAAIFDRDLPAALATLDRLTISGTSAITLIRALQRETQRLLSVAALGPGVGPDAGMKLRPPVYRSQWDTVSRRLRSWPAPVLSRILERIYDLEHQAKMAGPIADTALRYLTIQMAKPLPRR
ncbi:MAG: DNA polymerase III subunit delta [Pseudomonadota bacterium]